MPPTHVNLWPILAFRAYQHGYSHGFRLWTLARAMDTDGSGKVRSVDLREAAGDMGLSTRDYNRYLRGAKKGGMLTSIQSHSKTYYLVAGVVKVANRMECYYIGARRASLPLKDLFKRDWLSLVWAGWIATLKGKPMSRDKMHALTGVSQRIQRVYEQEREIIATPHYAHDETKDPKKIAMLQAFPIDQGGRPSAFVYQEKASGKNIVVWRLPDSRLSSLAETGKGRTRKINKTIQHFQVRRSSFLLQRVNVTPSSEVPVYPVRLFHPLAKKVDGAIRKLFKQYPNPKEIREVYASKAGGYGCQQWQVFSLDEGFNP